MPKNLLVLILKISLLVSLCWFLGYHLVPMALSNKSSAQKPEMYQNRYQETNDTGENKEVAGKMQSESNGTNSSENFKLEMERRFDERRRRVQGMCGEFGDKVKSNMDTTYAFSFYNPTYDLLICASRKGGSSSMRGLLNGIEGKPKQSNPSTLYPKYYFTFKGFVERTKKPVRIVVIRHPFVRLVSAFKDKYHNGLYMGSYDQKKQLGIFLKMHGWENEITKTFNFTTFLQLVIHQHINSGSVLNNHWNTAIQFCSLCTVDYDYVVQTETYDEDMGYILGMIGERSEHLPFRHRMSKTTDPFSEYMGYYDMVPADILSDIYHIFKYDMAMLGYGLTPHIREILRSQGTEMI